MKAKESKGKQRKAKESKGKQRKVCQFELNKATVFWPNSLVTVKWALVDVDGHAYRIDTSEKKHVNENNMNYSHAKSTECRYRYIFVLAG